MRSIKTKKHKRHSQEPCRYLNTLNTNFGEEGTVYKITVEKKNKKKHGPFEKQIVSRHIQETHAVVTVNGDSEDFERMKKVIKEAVRKYNYNSDNPMSFEIRMISHSNNLEEKRLLY